MTERSAGGGDSGSALSSGADRSRPRAARRLLALLLVVAVGYGAITFVQVWWASRTDPDAAVDSPAAVVLGAAQYNGSPSPVLRGRLDHAAELYLRDEVEIIVVTGGGRQDDITTEAKAAYDYLRSTIGIADERLRLEVDGTSTFEQLAAVARFLDDEGIDDVVIVTDPYHARRAQLIAREVGLDASVSVTSAGAPFGRLVRETGAVAIGQVISFRRLERLINWF
jgi:vancomycin permeability regulator SanA